MSTSSRSLLAPGPFHADQLRDGDRYELSNGHAIYCAPAGPVHSSRHSLGVEVLETDPSVEVALTDGGFHAASGTLRAPDVAVISALTQTRGWLPKAPPLALEYAAEGQDEADLKGKIRELLKAGTRYLWVARLTGLPRVEVHEPGQAMRVVGLDDFLEAPGVLRNRVRVRALFERTAAHEAVLRNLLQREGYGSVEEIRQQGEETGEKKGEERGEETGLRRTVREVCDVMGIALSAAQKQRLEKLHKRHLEQLLAQIKTERRWVDEVVTRTKKLRSHRTETDATRPSSCGLFPAALWALDSTGVRIASEADARRIAASVAAAGRWRRPSTLSGYIAHTPAAESFVTTAFYGFTIDQVFV